MARSMPAWQRLVFEGFFASREEAEPWILSGKVRVGDAPVTSCGQMVSKDKPITVRNRLQKYASKGGLKLEGALCNFPVSAANRVCIDAGASTGGFTDCLLRHGASLVYAVDVGYGQLVGRLRGDPRVINRERTNIGDPSLLLLDPPPTLGVVDLSYLPLRKAVPLFAAIMRETGDLLCLVKPLFEIESALSRRTGLIDDDAYVPLLLNLIQTLEIDGFAVSGLTHSPVTGNHGTLEFFLWIPLGQDQKASLPPHAIEAAVAGAKALPPYQK